jgi:hypothetical protein
MSDYLDFMRRQARAFNRYLGISVSLGIWVVGYLGVSGLSSRRALP